jgi:hypothetical protein
LLSAAQEEVQDLWADLSSARNYAYDQGERWSLECDWYTERIVMLSRFAGSPHWDQIPTDLILDGTWPGILRTASLDPGPAPSSEQRHALEQGQVAR